MIMYSNIIITYIDDLQLITDDQITTAARVITSTPSSWMLLGAEMGIKKEVLDRIDVNSRARNMANEYAAYEMLHRARESKLLSSTSQLIRASQRTRNFTLTVKLMKSFNCSCILTHILNK